MISFRDFLPCAYEKFCSDEEKRANCSKCELYKPKIPLPKFTPVVLNVSDYLICCKEG